MKPKIGDLVRLVIKEAHLQRPRHPWWFNVQDGAIGIVVGEGVRCEPVVHFPMFLELFWMEDGELEVVVKTSSER